MINISNEEINDDINEPRTLKMGELIPNALAMGAKAYLNSNMVYGLGQDIMHSFPQGALRGVLNTAAKYPDPIVQVIPPKFSGLEKIIIIQDLNALKELYRRPKDFNKGPSANLITAGITGGSNLKDRKDDKAPINFVVTARSDESYPETKLNYIANTAKDQAEEVKTVIEAEIDLYPNDLIVDEKLMHKWVVQGILTSLLPGYEITPEVSVKVAEMQKQLIGDLSANLLTLFAKPEEEIREFLKTPKIIKLMEDFNEMYELIVSTYKGNSEPAVVEDDLHEDKKAKKQSKKSLRDIDFLSYLSKSFMYAESKTNTVSAMNLSIEAAFGSTMRTIQLKMEQMAKNPDFFNYLKENVNNKSVMIASSRAAGILTSAVDLSLREVSIDPNSKEKGYQELVGYDLEQGSRIVLSFRTAINRSLKKLDNYLQETYNKKLDILELTKMIVEDKFSTEEFAEFKDLLGAPWANFDTNDSEFNRKCVGEGLFYLIDMYMTQPLLKHYDGIKKSGISKMIYAATSGLSGSYRWIRHTES
jgi:hypothetical protein